MYRGITFTPDSRHLVYGTDKDGEFLQPWSYDVDTGETRSLFETEWDITSARTGVDSGITFSPDGRFRVEIVDADARNEVTITDTHRDEAHLVQSEVVRFESYHGLEIPGLLYKPHGASAAHKVPAMVWVHGGPGA